MLGVKQDSLTLQSTWEERNLPHEDQSKIWPEGFQGECTALAESASAWSWDLSAWGETWQHPAPGAQSAPAQPATRD